MTQFLKKTMDWVLQKESEAAKNCKIDMADIDKQILYVKERRDKLKKECEENMSELEHILDRLHAIKAVELKCKTK